jgi:hypothetical protein
MIISCQYKLGIKPGKDDEDGDGDLDCFAWLMANSDTKHMTKEKQNAKEKLRNSYVLNNSGINLIDYFIYVGDDGNDNCRICDIIFDFNNSYSRSKARIIEEFVLWFYKELWLPKEIKILEVKMAEENIPVLFGVL